MKILVSGSSGFIGRHLVAFLKALEVKVVPIPRQLLYNPSELETFFRLEQPDYIFHLAAYGNMADHRILRDIVSANIGVTFTMLEASRNIPYQAFINVSSSSVLLPHQTLYSATKASGEQLARAFRDEYRKPIVTVRPYSVYGPGEADYRFIPVVFRSCLRAEPITLSLDAVHDWIYISDLIKQMWKCAKDVDNSTVNIGTGVGTPNWKVVQYIEQITGKQANIKKRQNLRSFDNKEWRAKDSPLRSFTPLEEGLKKIYETY